MKNQNIRISRYSLDDLPAEAFCADGKFRWEASVEPEDGSWVLFVPTKEASDEGMQPMLWLKSSEVELEPGSGEDVYVLAGSEEAAAIAEASSKALSDG